MRGDARGTGSGPALRLAVAGWLAAAAAAAPSLIEGQAYERPRAREAGVVIGRLPTGPWNAITDVPGVRVGHRTLFLGDSIRTGVTAVLPHGGNVFERRVRAAIVVGNGFGKLVGLSQVNELGELETPVLLTGTLSVFRAADALLDTLLAHPANRDVRSMNPVVGETNDGYLSDIRARPIRPEHVRSALREAREGPVEEGSVGAGTGTRALGWKGGIGTASRQWTTDGDTVTVGVLVQTNFGGSLRIAGVPVGEALAERRGRASRPNPERHGSVMIVIATDQPLAHRELERIGVRSFLGLGRVGSHMSHGSGDYAIVFSTDPGAPTRDARRLSRLFAAVVEATEEAVVNSLFRATTVSGFRGRTTEALPLEATLEILRAAGAVEPERD
ncbi:MAG: P1 family peptidase [Gemmatimonadota bacterium]|nr:P1 family peptidase [Gemmatimonadota bacterium]